MEFPFDCNHALSSDSEGYAMIDAKKLKKLLPHGQVNKIIDTFGQLSAKSQGLKVTITTVAKILETDNRVYFKTEGNKVIGFLKVGTKKLFYRDYTGRIIEMTPICVLDFYVYETVQRGGYGKKIFEKMLEMENTCPAKLAYDRPSPKLHAFLKRHYGLSSYIPQNNNYVIYQDYFETVDKEKPAKMKAEVGELQVKEYVMKEGKMKEAKDLDTEIPNKDRKKIGQTEEEIKQVEEKIKKLTLEAEASKSKMSIGKKDLTTSSAYGSHYAFAK